MMPSSQQSNVVNHSETDITNDSNIIPYSQYVIESQQGNDTCATGRPIVLLVLGLRLLPRNMTVESLLAQPTSSTNYLGYCQIRLMIMLPNDLWVSEGLSDWEMLQCQGPRAKLILQTICTPSAKYTDWDMLFQPLFDEFLNPLPSVDHSAPEVVALSNEVIAPVLADSTGSPSSTTVDTCNLMINQEQKRDVGCDVREKVWMEWMMFIRWNVTNGTTNPSPRLGEGLYSTWIGRPMGYDGLPMGLGPD
ncbi:hypothetical protein Tco_1056018 [Tanacetum coccineum]|uniref:Uncharacterized protein n=1 Tax=Tanacetum coccineum TaxID=301880 RepID=A0ABQ5H1B9_9ASTR